MSETPNVQLKARPNAQRHAQALKRSSALVRTFYRMYRPGRTGMTPEEIIPVLNKAGVKYVLMGTHGIGGWRSEPRTTDDVDFLVRKSDHDKAVQAIQEAFPHLKMHDLSPVTRFSDPGMNNMVVLDLMKPTSRFYLAVFRNTVPAGRTHRVPDLEAALVSKFAAMISPVRPMKKRLVDVGDFMDIVEENAGIIDMPKLKRLAVKVGVGCGTRIEEFVEDAKAGRPPQWQQDERS